MDLLEKKRTLMKLSESGLNTLKKAYGIREKDRNNALWLLTLQMSTQKMYMSPNMKESIDILRYFHIDDMLGEGSFATTYYARQYRELHGYFHIEPVALKLIGNITDEALKSIEREIYILRRLKENNKCPDLGIVCYYDSFKGFFKGKEYYVIVMEYINGTELYNLVADTDKLYYAGKYHARGYSSEEFFSKILSDSYILTIMKQLANILAYIHKRNIVHRDIKLENILLDKNDKTYYIDFGFSCLTEKNPFSCIKDREGTPLYLSPEKVNIINIPNQGDYYNIIYKSADVWALGIVFYELMYGHMPDAIDNYKNMDLMDTYNTIKQLKDEDIKFYEYRSEALINIVKGMLRVNYKDRYTVEWVVEKLNRIKL